MSLLASILPSNVIRQLKQGVTLIAQFHQQVTILFSGAGGGWGGEADEGVGIGGSHLCGGRSGERSEVPVRVSGVGVGCGTSNPTLNHIKHRPHPQHALLSLNPSTALQSLTPHPSSPPHPHHTHHTHTPTHPPLPPTPPRPPADIRGFTTLATEWPTEQIILMLNNMFTAFDRLCDTLGVYKVETIGEQGPRGGHGGAMGVVGGAGRGRQGGERGSTRR